MNVSDVTFVVLTTAFTCTCSHLMQFGKRLNVSSGPSVKLYGMSFSACTQRCGCFDGCAHVNYQRQYYLCELIQNASQSSVYENAYFVSPSVIPRSNSKSHLYSDDCISENVDVCLKITTEKGTNLRGNRNFVGSKIMIDCDVYFEKNGSNTATCTADGNWTEHGKCVQFSTMRAPCLTHGDCIDGDSECRGGQCWCKPGLSHDLASSACVTTCPGQYGQTFKIHRDYRILGHSILSKPGGTIKACMKFCLQPEKANYTCKSADYHWTNRCYLNKIPENKTEKELINISVYNRLLQRDCFSELYEQNDD